MKSKFLVLGFVLLILCFSIEARHSIDINVKDPKSFEKASQEWEALKQQPFVRQYIREHPHVAPTGDYYDFLPKLMGSLKNDHATLNWTTPCYTTNQATLKLDKAARSLTVSIASSGHTHITCVDVYMIATSSRYHFRFWGNAVISNLEDDDIADIEAHGVRVFYFDKAALTYVDDLIEILRLYLKFPFNFLNDASERNQRFLEEELDVTFTPIQRPPFYIRPEEIQDGDFLGKFEFTGIDTLIWYGTGSYIGHAVVALRIDGELYVIESTRGGVQKTPWNKYIEDLAIHSPNTTLLISRLKPQYAKLFDAKKAAAWYKTVEGLDYGYSNFVFGWIDTLTGNFPTPSLSDGALSIILSVLDRHPLTHDLVQTVFGHGLSIRLQQYHKVPTFCEDMVCVFQYASKLNLTLMELAVEVERDDFEYPNGPNMVCDVFVIDIYRSGGLFDALGVSIQAVENTPKDLTQMALWDTNWIPSHWPCASDGKHFCQFSGAYAWELPGYNSVPLYNAMNERCEALPKKYIRTPSNC